MDPNVPLPEKNIPDHELPEVRLNVSSKEPKHFSKRVGFAYGIYYIEVTVVDGKNSRVKKIFKIWAFRDVSRCKIRSSRSYERFMLSLSSLLPAV